MRRFLVSLAAIAVVVLPGASAGAVPVIPPLATSPNVQLLANIPGSFAGMVFKGHYAFATGWATGLTVFDISAPALPVPVGELPLPHFENEDVDLCGNTLLIANDRVESDYVGVLHVIDISNPSLPTLAASLPLGLTGEGRGPGHIANFVTADCSLAWVDGGDDVEVVDLSTPSNPRSLGTFKSKAATGPSAENPAAFEVTHDTERDSSGMLWSVGGGGVAGYQLTSDPLNPSLYTSSGRAGVNFDFDDTNSPYNDFILHNSQRASSDVLLITEEDYIDTDQAQPGSCNGQGKFETWRIAAGARQMHPIDTWTTELNGFLTGGTATDSKAPVTVNCSSHWFDHRNGVAAVGWYEQGVRFLDVTSPANIRQIGYYLPADGSTWAAYWSPTASNIVYTADAFRGIDVLRISNTGLVAAAPTVTAPIPSSWFGPVGTASTVTGFRPTTLYGWSCVLPDVNAGA
jgi:hypothetical protein